MLNKLENADAQFFNQPINHFFLDRDTDRGKYEGVSCFRRHFSRFMVYNWDMKVVCFGHRLKLQQLKTMTTTMMMMTMTMMMILLLLLMMLMMMMMKIVRCDQVHPSWISIYRPANSPGCIFDMSSYQVDDDDDKDDYDDDDGDDRTNLESLLPQLMIGRF